jgi:hypothetical protein
VVLICSEQGDSLGLAIDLGFPQSVVRQINLDQWNRKIRPVTPSNEGLDNGTVCFASNPRRTIWGSAYAATIHIVSMGRPCVWAGRASITPRVYQFHAGVARLLSFIAE